MTYGFSVLHLAEAVDRPIRPMTEQDLPSLVSDFTIKQGVLPHFIGDVQPVFNTSEGLPFEPGNDRNPIPSSDGILSIKGIYVAVVSGTHASRVEIDKEDDEMNNFKLIRYEKDPLQRQSPLDLDEWPATTPSSSEVTFLNTSWGRIWAEVADTIVVAAGGTCLW